ncbi:M20/M25/M40 family metallo-hydrolase [Luteibaculum oceani]|uniref:Carboxypeptidase Q n=1 Tax=Luteibaculum oceani TaxID=1294296 RepID=A0A5C6V870_9FLAO|nr:M20/M25/M40 family metallo-hydrolase [Luteibaculum oceani]TXC81523.1 M20/M25/M40 family metallo-hydrolase [Luteibaculum oceani]
MKQYIYFFSVILLAACTKQEITAEAIINQSKDYHSYQLLTELTKDIGPRLSGSANGAKAVEWGLQKFEELGFDTFYLQDVMVPHWERGNPEKGFWVTANQEIEVTALGGSVGTPVSGIKAEVIEVQDFKQLKDLGKDGVEGKIVFFNRPMNPKLKNTFRAYSLAVNQRSDGAWQAAQYGAVAVLVRSMTTATDLNPHTGVMRYRDSIPKIPALAIATEHANALSSALKTEKQWVQLEANCKWYPDTLSHNVIGEIKGKSNEIIAVGGHLDSWDLGEGAHDDGAGIVHSIDAVRILKKLGHKPNHTLRVVLFMNEENGARGGQKYAELAAQKEEKHLMAVESDRGGFTAEAFSIDGDSVQLSKLQSLVQDLAPCGIKEVYAGYGGVDIGFLREVDSTVVLVGLVPDPEKYFNYHHTRSDVLENVDPDQLASGSAAVAQLIYLVDTGRASW